MREKPSLLGVLLWLCGVASLSADTGAWGVDADEAWSDGANWTAGFVAGGVGNTAYFTNSVTQRRTVTVDHPATVGAMRFSSPTNNNWRFIGDGPITLDNGFAKPRIGSAVNQRVEILPPLAGTNGFVQETWAGDIEFDGINSGLSGRGELKAYTIIQSNYGGARAAARSHRVGCSRTAARR